MEVIEWRNKHHRCRYCQYCYTTECGGYSWNKAIFWKCAAKDKTLAINDLFILKGMFCKVFKAEELNEN